MKYSVHLNVVCRLFNPPCGTHVVFMRPTVTLTANCHSVNMSWWQKNCLKMGCCCACCVKAPFQISPLTVWFYLFRGAEKCVVPCGNVAPAKFTSWRRFSPDWDTVILTFTSFLHIMSHHTFVVLLLLAATLGCHYTCIAASNPKCSWDSLMPTFIVSWHKHCTWWIKQCLQVL